MGAQCERGWDVKCYKRPFFISSLTLKCKLGIFFIVHTRKTHFPEVKPIHTHRTHRNTDIYRMWRRDRHLQDFTSWGGDVVPCVHFQRALLYVLHPAVGSGDGGKSHKEICFVSFSKLKSFEHMRIKTLWRWIDLQLLEWLRFVIRCVKCIVVH